MKVIIDGVQYNTDTATLLSQNRSPVMCGRRRVQQLYKTHDGHFFICCEEYEQVDNAEQIAYVSIRPCSAREAYAWISKNSLEEAQLHLSKTHPTMTAQDLVLLADYRSGSPRRQKSYIHHAIFAVPDKSVYYIASNRIIEPLDYVTQVVSVSGVEDVRDFCERMCVRSMCQENARAWAEDHLPPRVYDKCFGSAEV